MGSGKTHLIKGIAAGAGAGTGKALPVLPSFSSTSMPAGSTSITSTPTGSDSVADFEMLGFDDFCYPESVVLIEWADKIEPALRGLDYIRVDLAHAGERSRTIRLRNLPEYLHLP